MILIFWKPLKSFGKNQTEIFEGFCHELLYEMTGFRFWLKPIIRVSGLKPTIEF